MESLESPRNMRFQRRSWVVERIGWFVLALLVAAAIFGAFGDGVLARTRATTPDGLLDIEYSRFLRYRAGTDIRVSIAPEAVADGRVRIWLSAPYIAQFHIEGIQPTPERAELAGERLNYTFLATEAARSRVIFRLRGERSGSIEGRIGSANTSYVRLGQFIYP